MTLRDCIGYAQRSARTIRDMNAADDAAWFYQDGSRGAAAFLAFKLLRTMAPRSKAAHDAKAHAIEHGHWGAVRAVELGH